MLSVLLLRIFVFLAFAALVLWLVAKLWPRRVEMLPSLVEMSEAELRAAKTELEEKSLRLSNTKEYVAIRRRILVIDAALAKVTNANTPPPPSAA